jgi:hypothetical protein
MDPIWRGAQLATRYRRNSRPVVELFSTIPNIYRQFHPGLTRFIIVLIFLFAQALMYYSLDYIYFFPKNVNAATTYPSVPVVKVGWITGAKNGEWFPGMSSFNLFSASALS